MLQSPLMYGFNAWIQSRLEAKFDLCNCKSFQLSCSKWEVSDCNDGAPALINGCAVARGSFSLRRRLHGVH